jgi:hypothetical protein
VAGKALERERAKVTMQTGHQQPNPLATATGQIAFQALCFGYFHLCQQMKVTACRAHRRAAAKLTTAQADAQERATPNSA